MRPDGPRRPRSGRYTQIVIRQRDKIYCPRERFWDSLPAPKIRAVRSKFLARCVALPGFGAVVAEDSGGGAVVGESRQAYGRRGSLFHRSWSAMLIHVGRGESGIG